VKFSVPPKIIETEAYSVKVKVDNSEIIPEEYRNLASEVNLEYKKVNFIFIWEFFFINLCKKGKKRVLE